MKTRLYISLLSLFCFHLSSAQYCTPATSNYGNYGEITNVTIAGGGLNNSNSYGNGGYQDFTATIYTAIVYSREVHTISVTRTLDAASPYSVKIWIDYDDDGNFTNSTTATDEVVALTDGDTVSTVTFNWTVPDSVVIGGVKKSTYGIHRMRVRNVYTANSNAANMSPCGLYAYNEVEDYKITIRNNSFLVLIPDSNFVKCLTYNYGSYMRGNYLDTLMAGQSTSTYLNATNYGIADLTGAKYFRNITTVYCNENKLTSLPELPKKTLSLYCSNNPLTSLPEIPTLEKLDCQYTQLTSLPYFPKLSDLNVSYNQLTELPPLNDTMYAISLVNNAGITCLPPVKVITANGNRGIITQGTGITCFSNRISHPNSPSMPELDNIPICNSSNNPHGCPIHCNAQFSLHPDVTTPHHWFALNESWGKSPIGYSWTWGDGGNSSGANASHTYSSAGYYKICLTITDDTTCTSTFCDSSTYISRMDEDNAIISIDVVNSLSTAIDPVTVKGNFIIYPNPCTTCEIHRISEAGDIIVTDLLGKTLKVALTQTSQSFSIRLPDNPAGIYFVKNLKTGEVEKFVKE